MSWKRFAKTFFLTLAAALVLLALLGFVLIRTGVIRTGAALRTWRLQRSTVNRQSFTVASEGGGQAAELDGSVLLLSRNRVTLYGPDGRTLQSVSGAFSEALLQQSGSWAGERRQEHPPCPQFSAELLV